MKITYIADTVIDGKSAASNHITEMINAIKDNGIEATLITATNEIKKLGKKDGILNIWHPKFKGGWIVFRTTLTLLLLTIKKTDAIYFRLPPSKSIAWALSKIKSHKSMELNGLETIKHKDFKKMADSADLIFVGTEPTKNILTQQYPEISRKTIINSNVGIDPEKFSKKEKYSCKKKLAIPPETKTILCVSGFQEHHDFTTILKAFESVTKEHTNATLIMVGDGPRRAEIEKTSKTLTQSKNIKFTGSITLNELPYYIGASDVCLNIMHAWKLKHGNMNAQKTYEYMASGKPTIETCDLNLPIPDWAKSRLTIIKPESPDCLSNAIKKILGDLDEQEKIAAENESFIKKNYSWHAIGSNAISHITRAIQQEPRKNE